MSSREERREAFNEQMNAWVSRQGLWFQLRHGADGQTISRIVGICLRLGIVLLVLTLCLVFYLVKRIDSTGFRENIRASIESALKAEECRVGGIRKNGETLTIRNLNLNGGDESFFHQLKARGVNTHMKLTDGLFGVWKGHTLTVEHLEVDVKAGSSDDLTGAKAFQLSLIHI